MKWIIITIAGSLFLVGVGVFVFLAYHFIKGFFEELGDGWRGGAASDRRVCSNGRCGSMNPPQATYCARCGQRL